MKNKHHLSNESVRKMTDEELGIELSAQRGKLFTARSQSVTEKVEDTSQFGEFKRNVARILTEQNARRRGAAGGAPASPSKPKAKAGAR
jgi:ribosomal protein L29